MTHSDGLCLSFSLHDELQATSSEKQIVKSVSLFFNVFSKPRSSEIHRTIVLCCSAHRCASASLSSLYFSASAGFLILASSSFSLRMISCSCSVICCVRSTTWTCIFSSSMRCLVLATWHGKWNNSQSSITVREYYLPTALRDQTLNWNLKLYSHTHIQHVDIQ